MVKKAVATAFHFHFDKFLFSDKYTLVFIAVCMGIILFNNTSATYIAEN